MNAFVLCILLCIASVNAADTLYLYVGPHGSDTNNCTDYASACRTLFTAIGRRTPLLNRTTVVYVDPGDYNPVNFTINLKHLQVHGTGPGVNINCFAGSFTGFRIYYPFPNDRQQNFTVTNINFHRCIDSLAFTNVHTINVANCSFNADNPGGTVSWDGMNVKNANAVNIHNSSFNCTVGTSPYSPVHLEGVAAASVTSCTFRDNIGPLRGPSTHLPSAIYTLQTNLTVRDSTFINNVGVSPAVILQDSNVIVETSYFAENYPGAISVLSNTLTTNLTLNNCSFYNHASPYSGSVLTDGSVLTSNIIFNDCTIVGNSAVYDGGAISVLNTELTISNSVFSSNKASNGGAIHINASSLVLLNSSFTLNSAMNTSNGARGGAISSSGSWIQDQFSRYSNNTALTGGAVYVDTAGVATSSFQSSTFTYNTVIVLNGNAGAVYVAPNAKAEFTGCSFVGNVAKAGNGGGLFCITGCELFVTSSSFSQNYAYWGGGVSNKGKTVITSSSFTNNTGAQGGAVFVNADTTITSSVITENIALQRIGDGIYINGATAENSLVVKDTYLTNKSPYTFCCSESHNWTTSAMNASLCQYPACSADCGGGSGTCDCTAPPVQQCNCSGTDYLGTHCNIFNQCLNMPYCAGPAYCNYDDHFKFTCESCVDGWDTNPDDGSCADINECSMGVSGCGSNSICTNTPGSFFCSCRPGFTGNGYVCNDVDECQKGTANCSAQASCRNTYGSYVCTCKDGYSGDGFNCTDTNECETGQNTCSAYARCENTVGSYNCSCLNGFSGDGRNCTDLNECENGMQRCSAFATCANTIGSYTCNCTSGYNGTGIICNDLDECALGTDSCSNLASCTNTLGSYTCACLPGYTGNGTFCQDLNECETGNNCSSLATCSNTLGSYVCTCVNGYNGTGITCQDVDECAQNATICGSGLYCINAIGNFTCSRCPKGFVFLNNVCTDICNINNGGCDYHTKCTNINGTATCGACPLGFIGTGYTNCTAQCGNGICEPLLGENCVSCYSDCRNATCKQCGDGVCDASENCTTCSEDCGTCYSNIYCPGYPTCNNHGICSRGVCACDYPWAGPACDQRRSNVQIGVPSDGAMIISASGSNVSFSISIDSLTEYEGDISITQADLKGKNFTLTNKICSSFTACNLPSNLQLQWNGTNVTVWTSTVTLNNKAKLEIIVYETNSTDTIEFAARITTWPFRANNHTLSLLLRAAIIQPTNTSCAPWFYQNFDNQLKWRAVNVNGVTLFEELSNTSIVDGRSRGVGFSQKQRNYSSTVLAATVPHFWTSASFGAMYSVFIGQKPPFCIPVKNEAEPVVGGSTPTILIAAPVAVGGAALVGAAFAIPKLRNRLSRRTIINTSVENNMGELPS